VFTRPLFCENSVMREGDLSKLNAAVFPMNGILSVVFFAFVLLYWVTG
jgi:hypothetical protein